MTNRFEFKMEVSLNVDAPDMQTAMETLADALRNDPDFAAKVALALDMSSAFDRGTVHPAWKDADLTAKPSSKPIFLAALSALGVVMHGYGPYDTVAHAERDGASAVKLGGPINDTQVVRGANQFTRIFSPLTPNVTLDK